MKSRLKVYHSIKWILLSGVGIGLYPLLFFYSRNFELVNSWFHLSRFLLYFLLVPTLIFGLSTWIFSTNGLKAYQSKAQTFITVVGMLLLLKICVYDGAQRKITMAILLISFLLAWILNTQHKKLVLLQWILALIGFIGLVGTLISRQGYDDSWKQLPDQVEETRFKTQPNIYLIQPDGYVNFSELYRGYYQHQDSSMQQWLSAQGFVHYNDFRSNYDATLSSNSAIFTMKHHYYEGSTEAHELPNARATIMADNPVLRTLEQNGYKRIFLAENPYLLSNRPNWNYDYVNFGNNELPFLDTSLKISKEIMPDLQKAMQLYKEDPSFYFIEIFDPKHISGAKKGEDLVDKKRDQYFQDLKKANKKIQQLTSYILENDPEALIVLMADHGGYVGMEYLQQGNEFTDDVDKIRSMFSSMLSIRWPNISSEIFETQAHSSVNLFRLLFVALSENPDLLDHLEPDESYMNVIYGNQGVYKVIDSDGNITSSVLEH